MPPQLPQRVRERRRGRVVSGQHEDQQVVADVLVGQRPSGLRVGGGDQSLHQWRIPPRIGTAGHQDLGGHLPHRRHRGTGPGPRGRRQPPGRANRPQRTVGRVRRRDVHVVDDDARTLVEVDSQHRAAQRLHGHLAAFGIEVDLPAVTPAVHRGLSSARHVTTEGPHVLLGEHGLQRPLPRPPLLVGQHEQAVTRRVAHLVVHDAPLGERVVTAEHVADAVRGEHRHEWRHQPLGPQLHAGDRTACGPDQLLPGVELPHRVRQLSDRQRIARRKRQRADIRGIRCGVHHQQL